MIAGAGIDGVPKAMVVLCFEWLVCHGRVVFCVVGLCLATRAMRERDLIVVVGTFLADWCQGRRGTFFGQIKSIC